MTDEEKAIYDKIKGDPKFGSLRTAVVGIIEEETAARKAKEAEEAKQKQEAEGLWWDPFGILK